VYYKVSYLIKRHYQNVLTLKGSKTEPKLGQNASYNYQTWSLYTGFIAKEVLKVQMFQQMWVLWFYETS